MWQVKYGKDFEFMRDAYRNQLKLGNNVPVPKFIQEWPVSDVFTDHYHKLYFELRQTNQNPMGDAPIPMSEITAYCKFLEEDDPELFVAVMLGADQAFLSHRVKKQEAK